MTQYLLAVHHDGTDQYTPDEEQTDIDTVGQFNQQLQDDGSWVFGGGLEWIDTSKTVDATGDEVITTDGPYVETKEHLGGFWIIEASDLDTALKIAEGASRACRLAVEVRPFDGT